MIIVLRLVLVLTVSPSHRMFLLAIGGRYDTCPLPCGSTVNVACGCKAAPNVLPYLKEQNATILFRKLMLRRHNQVREKLALGREGREYTPSAANMNILNYNLHLERAALCTALLGNTTGNVCARTATHEVVYTNVYIFGTGIVQNLVDLEAAIGFWYGEIAYVGPTTVNRYSSSGADIPKGQSIDHFSYIAKDDMTDVGCGVAATSDKGKIGSVTIVCNYGGSPGIINKPLYIGGAPCSACPFYYPCSSIAFPHLCGGLGDTPYETIPDS